MASIIKLAIAEDHALVRQGMIALLQEEEELECVIGAANGHILLEELRNHTVDVVLLDIEMPIMGGLQALEMIRMRYPHIKVIMISMHYEDTYISEYIAKGANGFLPKHADIEKVIDAIYAVREQGYYFDDKVSKALLNRLINEKRVVPVFPIEPLNDKELMILKMTCDGQSALEISNLLFMSKRTVEGYRKVLLQKTNAKNTAGLVMYALRHGIITLHN